MGQIITFDEALRRGIRPDERTSRNAQALKTCTNLRATQFGLKDFVDVTQPITDTYLVDTLSITKTWPFPQLFRGNGITLLCDEDTIYEVTETGSGTWTAAEITTYNFSATPPTWPSVKVITAGGPWHFVDFYSSWMLFNGSCVVFKTGFSTKVFVQDSVTINTGCAFKEGRAIYGGFDSTDFFNADWQAFFAANDTNAPDDVLAAMNYAAGADNNWVWWSTIGGGDLYWLFSHDLMVYKSFDTSSPDSGYDADNPYIFDLWRQNQMGARPMPWQGDVYKVLDMAEAVIVYGEDGVAALLPHSDPVATMGLQQIKNMGAGVGCASRGAAGGGLQGHMFVDSYGELWLINPDLTAERLGHKEIFSNMLGNDIVVSYDPSLREFYIADGTECYVRSEVGLTKGPQMPTNVSFAQGASMGIILDPAETDVVTLSTNPFDGGVRGVKEITEVRLATTDTDTTGWTVAIDYRFNKGGLDGAGSWEQSATVTCDDRGVARVKVSGIEFRVVLTNPDRTKCDLERFEIEVRVDGKKTLRKWVDAT